MHMQTHDLCVFYNMEALCVGFQLTFFFFLKKTPITCMSVLPGLYVYSSHFS